MRLNKNKIKESLTIEQVFDLCNEMGGDPQMKDGYFISRTICHGGESHKLYYYDNTQLFKCYTECAGEAFDIFELVIKVKRQEGIEWSLPQSVTYIASYFGLIKVALEQEEKRSLNDWKTIERYEEIADKITQQQIVNLKTYDESILKNFPHPIMQVWLKEGISQEVMDEVGICYNPSSGGIVIPHYNKDGQLIGIRERTLIKDEEDRGKYKPTIIRQVMYNHPLSFSLYNLNNSKENIGKFQKAIVFESEKSALQYRSFMGKENDISVAVCGSSLIPYQIKLLLEAGAKEIIIGFDRQYKELNDEEHKKWVKKLMSLYDKYKKYATISFLFDKEHLLEYKDSPTDKGKEVFLKLFSNRIMLN